MNKKYTAVVATLLAGALALSPLQAKAFDDLATYDNTTQQAVQQLADAHIIRGTSPTTFSPKDAVTRGQVVKMLGKYLEEQGASVPSDWDERSRFSDISTTTTDRELLKYSAVVFETGVFIGNNGMLQAGGHLTRENVALVLNRLASYILQTTDLVGYMNEKQLTAHVTDVNVAKQEAQQAIQALNALQISNVDTFNPKGTVQRVHFASFLAKLLTTLTTIKEETILPEKPTAPKPDIEPTEPINPLPEIPVLPVIPEDEDEVIDEEEPVIVESAYIDDAQIVKVDGNRVTITHNTIGTQTFTIDSTLQTLFEQQQIWQEAIATLYIEEDVVVEVSAITIQHAGTAQHPVVIDGYYFDDATMITIQSQYATIQHFDAHYELLEVHAPKDAVYTIGAAEFSAIQGDGALAVTFTDIITSDVYIDAPDTTIEIAGAASVTSITLTHDAKITVQDGGILYDVYAEAPVQQLIVNGYIETVTVDTEEALTLRGTGVINQLFGAATTVYVEADGVTVEDVILTSDVEAVTVQ
ncbi:S-layer homology domain-containing protein [Caryophanon tenue]|uniref:SLH domain-containing protein n=1 Tax=Caryophanon tenue TaxID=33978 RepID=A0A1C0YJT8_9BACL|nr:S-layer homology domain-containing protein [Caryophanon tenue]OCS87438.1 hypothetical protein A6M13_08960 [Caryophanon tenue]